mgnify:CR=1 FL=1
MQQEAGRGGPIHRLPVSRLEMSVDCPSQRLKLAAVPIQGLENRFDRLARRGVRIDGLDSSSKTGKIEARSPHRKPRRTGRTGVAPGGVESNAPLRKTKAQPLPAGPSKGMADDGLLSHPISGAVPSALRGLTTVFGMGTGVAPAR